MKIGDRVFVHGYVDEIRKDTIIIRNDGGYFGTIPSEVIEERFMITSLPSAQPEQIRCKDCKWFGKAGCAIMIADESDKPTENDYCSFAERRTDADMRGEP